MTKPKPNTKLKGKQKKIMEEKERENAQPVQA